MISTMMVYSASFTFSQFCMRHGYDLTALILNAIVVSFDSYVHWMFCYIYLKLQIEVKYLLDSRIYAAN
jgi:hypothetical protein